MDKMDVTERISDGSSDDVSLFLSVHQRGTVLWTTDDTERRAVVHESLDYLLAAFNLTTDNSGLTSLRMRCSFDRLAYLLADR